MFRGEMVGRSFYDFQVQMGFKEVSDVFQYEEVSQKMRNRFIFITENAFSNYYSHVVKEFWWNIINQIKIEMGVMLYANPFSHEVLEILLNLEDRECIYVFELIMGEFVESYSSTDFRNVEDFISKVNKMFLENSFGYEFVSKHLIKVDRQFTHQEIRMGAIQLLHEVEFESASNEYMQAFTDYKNGNLKSSITNAGKAFESTMKIICENLRYPYKQSDTAKKLISTLMTKEFIPTYLQTHFSGVVNTLESGLPTVRNKHSHGDGAIEVEVTDKVVRYALNLCATNIVLLVEIYNEHVKNM